MDKKERKKVEVTLKNILYFIDDESEQNRVIEALKRCENKMNDSKIKNKIDKFLMMLKKDYYSIVDFLVDDILSGDINSSEKKAIYELIDELSPSIESGKKCFLEKLKNLFDWS